jgi:carbon storage regulator CsrA
MLVLTRKLQESVVVGIADMSRPMLSITVVEIAGGKVRLGFQADTAVQVHRLEVWQRLQVEGGSIPANPGPGPPATD